MRILKAVSILGVAVALAGCTDFDVENLNAPDRNKAISTPEDVAALVGGAFNDWWWGNQSLYPAWGLSTLADEATSSWGNYAMRDLSSEPRAAYNNSATYNYKGHNEDAWYEMYTAISNVNDGLAAIDGGLELENEMAVRAFGKFVQGLAHGYLALFFDQAFIYTEDMDLANTEFELQPYPEIMTAALGMLQQAIDISEANTFTLDENWVPGQDLDNTDLAMIAHSYMARLMTAVARTPSERDAVDWNTILAHIDAGITEDFGPNGDLNNWLDYYRNYIQRYDWFRADYMTIGPADTSGAFQAWLDTPVADRQPFDIETADKRIYDPDMSCDAIPSNYGDDPLVGVEKCGKYFYYRATQNHDPARGTYHLSRYGFSRFIEYRKTWTGYLPILTVVEMDLLKAEYYLRNNMLPEAAELINNTRVTNGELPPLTGAESAQELWDAMMYEKGLEMYGVTAGLAYYDKRGWGKLVEGSPLHFPLPAKELETLQIPLYTFGGGGPGSAP